MLRHAARCVVRLIIITCARRPTRYWLEQSGLVLEPETGQKTKWHYAHVPDVLIRGVICAADKWDENKDTCGCKCTGCARS